MSFIIFALYFIVLLVDLASFWTLLRLVFPKNKFRPRFVCGCCGYHRLDLIPPASPLSAVVVVVIAKSLVLVRRRSYFIGESPKNMRDYVSPESWICWKRGFNFLVGIFFPNPDDKKGIG